MPSFLTPESLFFVFGTACVLLLLPRIPVHIASGLAGCAIAVCLLIEPEGFIRSLVVGEEGGVDLSTGLVFLVASGLMFWCAVHSRGTRRRWLFFMGTLFLVAAGEETSWLQLYLDYDTPQGLRRLNQQGEMTLHNLVSSRVMNSAFLMWSAFLFLLGPILKGGDERAGKALRVYFAVFTFYFLLLVLTPREFQSRLVTLIYILALMSSVGLWAIAPYLWNQTRLSGPLRSLVSELRFGPSFLVTASLLFGAWAVYGIRFRSIGDLSFIPTANLRFPTNIDDELLEYFSAILSVLLAWRQMPASTGGPGVQRK
jgi:hypothetical protein